MAESNAKLYTLTEVAKLCVISMPTLQRYKKLYQDRIPSKGSGRSQRYPKEALDVFRELKKENVSRRGRPRKTASAAPATTAAARRAPAKRGRKKAAAAKAAVKGAVEKLLTLTEIGKLTKISYPTLLRYVKTHGKQIPHRGTGRTRRYLPGAVDIFKSLRAESKAGRRAGSGKKAAATGKPAARGRAASAAKRSPGRPRAVASEAELTARVKSLEKALKQAERAIGKLEKQAARPIRLVAARK